MPRILISAAMRGGSTLVANILNANSKIQIIENFHFHRFLYEDKPISRNELEYKLREMGLRLKIRYNININEINVLKSLKHKKLNYKTIYDALILEQLKINPRLKIIGEDSPLNWRFISTFCSMYKNAKVIHLIRDPRSIFASWKKITYQKIDKWGCVINCIDSMKTAEKLTKKISKKNYLPLKFEDILENPKKYSLLISKFINVKFEKNMILPKNWNKIFKSKFASLGWSSIENKKIDGFFTDRINSWERELSREEIEIIEYYTKKNLKFWKYSLSQKYIRTSTIINFEKKIKKSNYLNKIFSDFIKKGKSTDKLRDDPKNPKHWGDGKKNKKRFLDSNDGKNYLIKLSKIKKSLLKK